MPAFAGMTNTGLQRFASAARLPGY
jgi:hypothetical protein